jgi:hypothetical protein
VNDIALNRLNVLRSQWNEQPDVLRRKGSVSTSLMNAMVRINALYRRLFVDRPEPLMEIESSDEPAGAAAGTPTSNRQEDT